MNMVAWGEDLLNGRSGFASGADLRFKAIDMCVLPLSLAFRRLILACPFVCSTRLILGEKRKKMRRGEDERTQGRRG